VKQNVEVKEKKIERVIGHLGSKTTGPCCLFFGGVHGNEASGTIALKQVLRYLENLDLQLKGSFYGLGGNLQALQTGKRYTTTDLNRLWTENRMKTIETGEYLASNEDEMELLELYSAIKKIMEKEEGPFYFFDLHTTSSKTVPFITLNDSLLNRKFAELFPLPLVLGIEEYLEGPMLSYYNEKGYVSFGFEAGEHSSDLAIQNHEAFVYLSLVLSGVIDRSAVDYAKYFKHLAKQGNALKHFYEIYYRFAIDERDHFEMRPGFENFQMLQKGDLLATHNNKPIEAKENSIIFMPLYQASGNDGFFLIKQTRTFFLRCSTVVRKLKLDRLLPLLPGISWYDKNKEKMLVDERIARFFAKPFLHLLGYRASEFKEKVLIIKNRESSSKHADYKNEEWY